MNRLSIALAATALALLAGCQDNAGDAKGASSTGSTGSAVKTESKSANLEAKAAPGAGAAGTDANAASSKAAAVGTSVAPSPSAAKVDYQEVRVGNKVYVVGSADAAQQAKAGKLEKPVRAIGFGDPGDKVYFEEKNQAALEAEFNRRHDGK
jgi:hypothetical protein